MMAIAIMSSLLIMALPIVLIVLLVQHRGGRPGREGGGHGMWHFFQYVLLFGLMVVAASGVTDLCGLLADGQGVEGGDDLALAITFTVFGIPMVAVVAAWVRRDLRRGPDERQSAGWAAYVTLASLTTLIVAMSAAGELVSAVLGGHFTQWAVVARLLVWGLLWWVHLLFSERLLSESRRQPHRALGSLIGLCASIAGLTWLLGSAVTTMMGDDGGAVVVGVHDELAAAAGCFAAGVAV